MARGLYSLSFFNTVRLLCFLNVRSAISRTDIFSVCRPLVASYGVLPKLSEKQTSFVGHLDIGRDRRSMQREMVCSLSLSLLHNMSMLTWDILCIFQKEAVSTSHYSQHNTIEFEMAMEWCLLQSRSEKWWKNLYEVNQLRWPDSWLHPQHVLSSLVLLFSFTFCSATSEGVEETHAESQIKVKIERSHLCLQVI